MSLETIKAKLINNARDEKNSLYAELNHLDSHIDQLEKDLELATERYENRRDNWEREVLETFGDEGIDAWDMDIYGRFWEDAEWEMQMPIRELTDELERAWVRQRELELDIERLDADLEIELAKAEKDYKETAVLRWLT